MAGRAHFKERIAPALEVIAAARDPLPLDHLTKIFRWSQSQKLEFMRSLGSLFIDGEGGLRAFHKSLLDWLTDPKRAGKYFIEEKQGHARIAEIGFDRLKDSVNRSSSNPRGEGRAHRKNSRSVSPIRHSFEAR